MTSLSLAWVITTMVKNDWEIEFYPVAFIFTGIVDVFIAGMIFGA